MNETRGVDVTHDVAQSHALEHAERRAAQAERERHALAAAYLNLRDAARGVSRAWTIGNFLGDELRALGRIIRDGDAAPLGADVPVGGAEEIALRPIDGIEHADIVTARAVAQAMHALAEARGHQVRRLRRLLASEVGYAEDLRAWVSIAEGHRAEVERLREELAALKGEGSEMAPAASGGNA